MTRPTAEHEHPTDDAMAHRREAPSFFLVTAVLAGVSLALSIASRSLDWPWLRLAPFGFVLCAAVMMCYALAYFYRALFTSFWQWYQDAYARNERRARDQADASEARTSR